jgi:hypothetical protein
METISYMATPAHGVIILRQSCFDKRNKKILYNLIAAGLLFCIAGCGATLPRESHEISIKQALSDLGEGLKIMRDKIGDQKTGLMASEAEVTFKLAASGTTGSGLTLDLAPTSSYIEAIAPTVKGSYTKEISADKSNTITIKFKSVAFGKKTTSTTTGSENDRTTKTVIDEALVDPIMLEDVLNVLKKHDIPTLHMQ